MVDVSKIIDKLARQINQSSDIQELRDLRFELQEWLMDESAPCSMFDTPSESSLSHRLRKGIAFTNAKIERLTAN